MLSSMTGEPRLAALATPSVVETRVAPNFGIAFHELCLHESADTTRHLRNATVALVKQLKADGLPPERVIIAIKQALVRFGGCASPPHLYDETSSLAGERHAPAYHSVLAWSLDTYFRTDQ